MSKVNIETGVDGYICFGIMCPDDSLPLNFSLHEYSWLFMFTSV